MSFRHAFCLINMVLSGVAFYRSDMLVGVALAGIAWLASDENHKS